MPDPSSPDERVRLRIREAEDRAAELVERLGRLRAGTPVGAEDIDRALRAVVESQRHSSAAHARAGAAHRRAAQAHRSAALMADDSGHPSRADEHRSAAMADDEAAELDEVAARPRADGADGRSHGTSGDDRT
jgi:hypothetical protein